MIESYDDSLGNILHKIDMIDDRMKEIKMYEISLLKTNTMNQYNEALCKINLLKNSLHEIKNPSREFIDNINNDIDLTYEFLSKILICLKIDSKINKSIYNLPSCPV